MFCGFNHFLAALHAVVQLLLKQAYFWDIFFIDCIHTLTWIVYGRSSTLVSSHKAQKQFFRILVNCRFWLLFCPGVVGPDFSLRCSRSQHSCITSWYFCVNVKKIQPWNCSSLISQIGVSLLDWVSIPQLYAHLLVGPDMITLCASRRDIPFYK